MKRAIWCCTAALILVAWTGVVCVEGVGGGGGIYHGPGAPTPLQSGSPFKPPPPDFNYSPYVPVFNRTGISTCTVESCGAAYLDQRKPHLNYTAANKTTQEDPNSLVNLLRLSVGLPSCYQANGDIGETPSTDPDTLQAEKECMEPCPATCLQRYWDGVCDQDCNVVQCGYDGMDCSAWGKGGVLWDTDSIAPGYDPSKDMLRDYFLPTVYDYHGGAIYTGNINNFLGILQMNVQIEYEYFMANSAAVMAYVSGAANGVVVPLYLLAVTNTSIFANKDFKNNREYAPADPNLSVYPPVSNSTIKNLSDDSSFNGGSITVPNATFLTLIFIVIPAKTSNMVQMPKIENLAMDEMFVNTTPSRPPATNFTTELSAFMYFQDYMKVFWFIKGVLPLFGPPIIPGPGPHNPSANSPMNSSGDGHGLAIGLGVGIGVAVVALLVCGVFYYRKRKAQTASEGGGDDVNQFGTSKDSMMMMKDMQGQDYSNNGPAKRVKQEMSGDAYVSTDALFGEFLNDNSPETKRDGNTIAHLSEEQISKLIEHRKYTPLMIAVEMGDFNSASMLLKAAGSSATECAALLSPCNDDGETALYVAVRRNDYAMAKLILETASRYPGAILDVTQTTNRGSTAIHEACTFNEVYMLELLVGYASAVSAVSDQDAGDRRKLSLVNMNVQDKGDCSSPLITAVKYGAADVVEYLMTKLSSESGSTGCTIVDPKLKDYKEWNAVHWACSIGDVVILDILASNMPSKVRQAVLNAHNDEGVTPLYLAAKDGQFEIVQYLLSQRVNRREEDHFMRNASKIAEIRGHLEIVKMLNDWTVPDPPPIHRGSNSGQQYLANSPASCASTVGNEGSSSNTYGPGKTSLRGQLTGSASAGRQMPRESNASLSSGDSMPYLGVIHTPSQNVQSPNAYGVATSAPVVTSASSSSSVYLQQHHQLNPMTEQSFNMGSMSPESGTVPSSSPGHPGTFAKYGVGGTGMPYTGIVAGSPGTDGALFPGTVPSIHGNMQGSVHRASLVHHSPTHSNRNASPGLYVPTSPEFNQMNAVSPLYMSPPGGLQEHQPRGNQSSHQSPNNSHNNGHPTL
eukprot:Nk52_evm2s2309 gene=Nk52_evmTU2s2309